MSSGYLVDVGTAYDTLGEQARLHELRDGIRQLCRKAVNSEDSVNAVVDWLITELGRLTGDDFWREEVSDGGL